MTEKTLYLLSHSGFELANDAEDVRHRKVYDRFGAAIGQVDDLLVDDEERRVRFLWVTAGGFLGIGAQRFLIPVDAVTSVESRSVHIDRTHDVAAGAPLYDPEVIPSISDWSEHYLYWGYPPFWASTYIAPGYPYQ